jgi:signal transduction histidine kinase
LEMHDPDRSTTLDERSLLTIFSTDIAQLMEDSHLYEQTKALITAEERNRLARDLHDSVTQVLFSASLLAEVLPQIWRRNPELGLQRLEKLQRLTRGALAEMRTMLLELRPAAVIKTPLGDLLAQLTEAVASRSGLPFQLFIEQISPLPEEVQMNFYRIAQEALNNVVKHSQAKHVVVSLKDVPLPLDANGVSGREVTLVIQDDGVGFSSRHENSSHLGISIMRERAAAIQAFLSLESEPGYGTQVSLVWSNESEWENL